jgi:hypothetical protein
MIESVDSFTFESDEHAYVANGSRGVSVTELSKKYGLISFDGIRSDWLEIARNRGKMLHAWSADFDRTGDDCLLSMPEEWVGYAEAYQKFRRESGMEPVEIEVPLMVTILGVLVGGTPDRKFRWKKYKEATGDLKFCSAVHPAWCVQTSGYEVCKKKTFNVGHTDRFCIQLFPDGRYHVDWHRGNEGIDAFLHMISLEAFKANHRSGK